MASLRSSVVGSSSRQLIAALVTTSLLGLSAGGCDTIRARSRAQDGVKLYREGQVVEASQKFEEAQQLDATIPVVWLNLGFASLAVYQAGPRTPLGQAAAGRAIAALERYLTLRPDEERAKSYLVQTFVDTGRYEDAEAFFKPSVEKRPPDSQALATLGTIASKVGRFDDAARWYQRRIDAEPESGDARLALGVLLWDRLKSHPALPVAERVEMAGRALSALKEARRLQPGSPNAFLYTNLVYRERANANLGEDPKRADLELAGAYFRVANGMGKAGGDLSKEQRLIDETTPKADVLVHAAMAASAASGGLPGPPAGSGTTIVGGKR